MSIVFDIKVSLMEPLKMNDTKRYESRRTMIIPSYQKNSLQEATMNPNFFGKISSAIHNLL